MRKKIAFKPHATRGEKIIKILEGMGGVNKYNLDGSKGILAIETNRGNYITNDWDMMGLWRLGYEVYTLETWEENNEEKMVSVDKVKNWLFDNFSEWERDGDYNYGQPYMECAFDTFKEMLDSFDKLIEE